MTEVEQIAALYIAGKSREEMVSETGLSLYKIGARVSEAKTAGLIPKRTEVTDGKKARLSQMTEKHCLKIGSVADMMSELTRDQFEWLMEEATDCGCATVAEYLGQMVQYAYGVEKRRLADRDPLG